MGQVREMETGRNLRGSQEDCTLEVPSFKVQVEQMEWTEFQAAAWSIGNLEE